VADSLHLWLHEVWVNLYQLLLKSVLLLTDLEEQFVLLGRNDELLPLLSPGEEALLRVVSFDLLHEDVRKVDENKGADEEDVSVVHLEDCLLVEAVLAEQDGVVCNNQGHPLNEDLELGSMVVPVWLLVIVPHHVEGAEGAGFGRRAS